MEPSGVHTQNCSWWICNGQSAAAQVLEMQPGGRATCSSVHTLCSGTGLPTCRRWSMATLQRPQRSGYHLSGTTSCSNGGMRTGETRQLATTWISLQATEEGEDDDEDLFRPRRTVDAEATTADVDALDAIDTSVLPEKLGGLQVWEAPETKESLRNRFVTGTLLAATQGPCDHLLSCVNFSEAAACCMFSTA